MHHMFINYTHYMTHTQIGPATLLPRFEGVMDEMGSKSATFKPCHVVVKGNGTTTSPEVCIPPKKVCTSCVEVCTLSWYLDCLELVSTY